MRMFDIISKKKYNESLSKEEIDYVINEYTNGTIPDYQMSAMLMAIYFNGMENEELAAFTLAMRDSGDLVDLSPIEGIKVDKHSTGGVGDKTTLIVGPIVAACGVPVTNIGDSAFIHNQNIKEIILPDTIVTIEDFAFAYSTLRYLTLPSH